MCNETTMRELEAFLAKRKLSRRDFAKGMSAGLAIGATASGALAATHDHGMALNERDVRVPTSEGEADGMFITPASGAHAAVIFWPDIHGVRPAFYDMARRLARSGYAVLAMNPYYRTFTGRLFGEGEDIFSEGGWDRARPHYESVSPDMVVRDAAAYVAWLDQQAEVDTTRAIGAVGFCMTGSWTLRAAAAVPTRIQAPCSFHGGGLVTEEADSPHRLAGQMAGGVLIAIAENDHERQPEAQGVLIEAFEAAGIPAEIEVYDGALHGWVPTDGRAYHPEQSERAWGRMLALFETQLAG